MRFDGPKYTYRWWSYDVVFEVLQWMRGFVRFIRGFMHIKTWYKMKRRLEVKLYHFILFFFERLLNTLDFIAFISVEKYECFNFLILWLTADFSYIYRAVESPLQTLQKKIKSMEYSQNHQFDKKKSTKRAKQARNIGPTSSARNTIRRFFLSSFRVNAVSSTIHDLWIAPIYFGSASSSSSSFSPSIYIQTGSLYFHVSAFRVDQAHKSRGARARVGEHVLTEFSVSGPRVRVLYGGRRAFAKADV